MKTSTLPVIVVTVEVMSDWGILVRFRCSRSHRLGGNRTCHLDLDSVTGEEQDRYVFLGDLALELLQTVQDVSLGGLGICVGSHLHAAVHPFFCRSTPMRSMASLAARPRRNAASWY